MSISGVDTMRMGMAVSHPGIDPRTWVTLAVVNAVNVTAEGVIVDITTITGINEVAVVTPFYAGNGYGFYAPVQVGSFVVVAHPEGESNTGGRVVGMVWDRGTPPPQDVTEHPDDLVCVVQPGKSLRIIATGGGDVVLEARDDGGVKLGGPDASRGVARINDKVAITTATLTALQAQLDLRYTPLPGSPPPNIYPATGDITAVISSASDKVSSE